MSDSVQMPALGESVTEGTVTRWLKQVGDRVEVDEPLLEVSTDKVDTEIPSPVAGVIEEILVAEDETVEVGRRARPDRRRRRAAAAAPAGGPSSAGRAGGAVRAGGRRAAARRRGGAGRAGAAAAAAGGSPQQAPPGRRSSARRPAAAAAVGGGTRIKMPALGESVTEGTVTRWLKREGDTVDVDEPLLEVSTDKVDTEIPSPVGGVVQKILVSEDETVAVGADLAIVGGTGGGTTQQERGRSVATGSRTRTSPWSASPRARDRRRSRSAAGA